jgi:multisubunit Na+/H+ antiporter MnhE subunit
MLYTHRSKNFRHHVHPTLQRRIRIFFVIGALSLVFVARDIWSGTLSWQWALVGLVLGTCVGWFTSRIFHLSWAHDGQQVVGRIDRIGWMVLAAYIIFEIIRATLFTTVIHTGSDPTAITFAFVSAALISRMFGLRGRILRILTDEKVFG